MNHRFAVLALLLVVSACAQDDERAPLLAPSGGVSNPVSCDELRASTPQPNEAGRFWMSGGEAECVVDGQWCPADWLEGRCDAGSPFANCLAGAWVVTCQALGEAGASDGEAGAADGDTDA